MTRQISLEGLQLVKRFERLRKQAYRTLLLAGSFSGAPARQFFADRG